MCRKTLGFLFLLSAAVCFFSNIPLAAQAPYGFQFVSTREAAVGVLYDPFHQLFYVTVPGENSVYVINESDGNVAQKISIPSAFGLDLSVDGTRLYVTSSATTLGYPAAQGYFVIDTTPLHIIDFVEPTINIPSAGYVPSYNVDNVPRFIAALSNGKVAYTAGETGVTGGSIFLNDPATNIATNIVYSGYYDGDISKALNGSAFVAVSADSAGEAIGVYDTASGSYIANKYFSTTNNSDVIMSPDGTLILAGGHLLLDRNLNQIADLSTSASMSDFARSSSGSTFSNDGSRIYVASTLATSVTNPDGSTSSYSNPVIRVYSSSTQQLLGYIPLPAGIQANTVQAIAVGNSGRAILTTSVGTSGFLELNVSTPNINLPAAVSQSLSSLGTTSPGGGVAANPAATTVNGAGFRIGATVFFGQNQASSATVSSQNVINVQPPSSVPGLVPVTVGFPDGWAILAPNGYSYGPVVTHQDVTAGDSNGGAIVTLTGYGFNVSSGYPQITVGGRTAAVTTFSNTYIQQAVTFTVPAGTIGAADIQLTSLYGTTTLKSAFEYVRQQTIPAIQPWQMVVDNLRNQLYVADSASGNVLAIDAGTLAVRTLFSSATSPATALAITPDGSQLLVASYNACTLDIIDLDTGAHVKTIVPVPGNIPSSLAPNNVVATSRGTAILSFNNTAAYLQGALYEVNLTTGATAPLLLGVQNTRSILSSTLLAASADGSTVYVTPDGNLGVDGGAIDIWQAALDASGKEMFYTGGIDSLTTTDTGDKAQGDSATYDPSLRTVDVLAPDSALVSGRSVVLGTKLHSSGSLLYMPTTKGVEIYDVHTGAMVLSVGNAAGSLAGTDNLAINHAGDRLYLAQKSGIAVIDLPNAPLSIGSLTPAQGPSTGGTAVILRGSGFLPGASVTVDGNPTVVQFVDSTKLTLTTPSVSPAKDTVVVTNPDGTTYSLDAAFDASPVTILGPPVLTSISPSYINSVSPITLQINGSGFTTGSVAFLNGIPGATTYYSSSEIIATFYPAIGAASSQVTVTNPPNPTPSNPMTLTTYVDGPYLNSISPSSIPAGSSSFTLSIIASSLSPGSVVLWNGTPLPTTYVSSSSLLATVPATDVAAVGTAAITVSSPLTTVGPPTSNAQTFTITPNIAAAVINPSSPTFGPVLLGDNVTSTLTVSSTGQLPLNITGITLSDTVRFTQTNTCTSVVTSGNTCTIQVTFKPDSTSLLGVTPGIVTLTLVSNAATAPTVGLFTSVGDLRLSDPGNSHVVAAGKSITFPINFNLYGSIPNAAVQFSCSGLPQGATCSFNPSSAPLAVTGITNLTLSTTGTSNASLKNLWWKTKTFPTITTLAALCLFGLRRRRIQIGLFLLLFSALLLGLNACSSGNSSGGTGGSGGSGGTNHNATPLGIYAITITGASGNATPTTTVNVTVGAS
jgi:hypothetical protein